MYSEEILQRLGGNGAGRMSKYRCPYAIVRGARDAIRCRVSGTVCAHQKMCLMEGRIVLTADAMKCPGREQDADVDLDPAGRAAAGVDH